MARLLILPALVAVAAGVPALAQDDSPTPPARESQVEVFGNDPCPQSVDGEIVVCARRPEEERYRVPPALRERRDRPAETSWVARNEALEEDARTLRPDSCSVVGSGGHTGCAAAFIRQWAAERRMRRAR